MPTKRSIEERSVTGETLLCLRFERLVKGGNIKKFSLEFPLFSSDHVREMVGRRMIQRIADSLHIHPFNDSEQLHGKVFVITVLDGVPLPHVFCRKAKEAEAEVFLLGARYRDIADKFAGKFAGYRSKLPVGAVKAAIRNPKPWDVAVVYVYDGSDSHVCLACYVPCVWNGGRRWMVLR